MTPAASRSLCAMTAVGRVRGSANSTRPAANPSSMELPAHARGRRRGRRRELLKTIPRHVHGDLGIDASQPTDPAASGQRVTIATRV
jgi:hypothetical protein